MLKKVLSFILESIFPIVIIIIAIVISYTPTIGQFTFDTDAIILSLFSLLAIDSILDKYKTKKRIISKVEDIDYITDKIETKVLDIGEKVNAIKRVEILKKRSDFERLEHIFINVKKSLFVSGINLEGIVPSCSIIKELVKKGVYIRLLMLDPNGKKLAASSDMSGVSSNERKKKIRANLDFLLREFESEIQLCQIEIRVIDDVLPMSFIGIDTEFENGRLIVQNYLYKTPSSKSLMLEFSKQQLYWYNLYTEQLELMWNKGHNV